MSETSPEPPRARSILYAAVHWCLVALAVLACAAAIPELGWGRRWEIAGSVGFLLVAVALLGWERWRLRIPLRSARGVLFVWTIAASAFQPAVELAGRYPLTKPLVFALLPAALSAWAFAPTFAFRGPQPTARQGRFTPTLLAVLGVVLNMMARDPTGR